MGTEPGMPAPPVDTRIVSFLLGLVIGNKGLGWLVHLGYWVAIAAAFGVGRWMIP